MGDGFSNSSLYATDSDWSITFTLGDSDGGSSGGSGGGDSDTVVEFSAEVFAVTLGTSGRETLDVQNRLNQEINVSVVLPQDEDDCSQFGLENVEGTGFVSSGVYQLPSASDSFTEGSRSIGVEVSMPDNIGENETLRCEAVITLESGDVSGVTGDLVLRAEPGREPFTGVKSVFNSLGSGEAVDDLGALLFYLMQGPRELVVNFGFLGCWQHPSY